MAKNISNLDKSLKQNITPADIGAAASSHGTHLTLGTGASNAAAGNHTHSSYATTTITGSLSSLKTSEKGSLVGAINELFQSANNGKQLIANAIGEPLDSNDTFSAMSSDINGLLSTFKTNMMNNGVTVENGDKFKSLIDKIATLADSEGKGIQFAEGAVDRIKISDEYYKGVIKTIDININFNPTMIVVCADISNNQLDIDNISVSSTVAYNKNNRAEIRGSLTGSVVFVYIQNITQTSFDLGVAGTVTFKNFKWYAIGVGEEDTTLRDSLADILENKGVDVTEEDDMASLIGKVETMKSGGYNIEVVSELPTKADDYQIAILDSNTDAHIYIDTIASPSALNMYSFKDGDIYVRNITSIDIPGVHRAKILTQNITKSYTIQSILKYNSGSFSYLGDSVYEYLDNKWNLIFGNVLNIYRDSVLVNDVTFGKYSSSSSTSVNTSVNAEQYQVTLNKPTSTHLACSTNVPIDVTNYNKLIFELKSLTFSSVSGDFYVGVRKDQTGTGFDKATLIANAFNYQPGVYIVDVSDLTGSYYLGIGAPAYKHSCITLKFNFSAIYLTV